MSVHLILEYVTASILPHFKRVWSSSLQCNTAEVLCTYATLPSNDSSVAHGLAIRSSSSWSMLEASLDSELELLLVELESGLEGRRLSKGSYGSEVHGMSTVCFKVTVLGSLGSHRFLAAPVTILPLLLSSGKNSPLAVAVIITINSRRGEDWASLE